jgi:hypothetical protein
MGITSEGKFSRICTFYKSDYAGVVCPQTTIAIVTSLDLDRALDQGHPHATTRAVIAIVEIVPLVYQMKNPNVRRDADENIGDPAEMMILSKTFKMTTSIRAHPHQHPLRCLLIESNRRKTDVAAISTGHLVHRTDIETEVGSDALARRLL